MDSAADENRVCFALRVGDLRGEDNARLPGDVRVAETDTALGDFLGDVERDGVVLFRVRMVVGRGGMPLEGQDSSCNDQGAVPKFNCRRSSQFQCEKRLSLSKSAGLWVPKGWSVGPWNLPCLTENGRSFSVAA